MTLNFTQFTEETLTALAQPTEQDILEAHAAAVTYQSKPFKNLLLTLPDDLEGQESVSENQRTMGTNQGLAKS